MSKSQNDKKYFLWLVSQINIPNDRTYFDLFDQMHNFEFVWVVPNDNNRVQDGRDLRFEFFDRSLQRLNDIPVSVLEVLISLSRRISFITNEKSSIWAWKLLKNLGLTKIPDPITEQKAYKINEILDTLVWRTYQPDGRGGFFPLLEPIQDQTKVEIWYQMNSYVMEIDRK